MAQMDADSRGGRAAEVHGIEGLPCNPGAKREVNIGMGIHETVFFASSRLRVRKSRLHPSRVQRMGMHGF